jgi:hypothetical protein
MISEDQTAVIDFLAASSTHDGADVEVIETHASIVFLAGARAWKPKRAVRYDYLDFSSAERRKTLCEAPVRVNRRTAPTSRCRPAVPSALPAPSRTVTACSPPADASWGYAPRRWSCWPPRRYPDEGVLRRMSQGRRRPVLTGFHEVERRLAIRQPELVRVTRVRRLAWLCRSERCCRICLRHQPDGHDVDRRPA